MYDFVVDSPAEFVQEIVKVLVVAIAEDTTIPLRALDPQLVLHELVLVVSQAIVDVPPDGTESGYMLSFMPGVVGAGPA